MKQHKLKCLAVFFLVVFFVFLGNTKNIFADVSTPISTCEELRDMSPLSGSFYLDQDIDCSDTINWNDGDGWEPLGEFTGTLDGNNHAITDLYIDRSSTDYIGLFSGINGGEITDLSLTNVDITGQEYVGALSGTVISSSVIENITTSGSVNGVAYIGGISGDSYNSSFENCISSADITGTYDVGSIGGLIGSIYDGSTIASCGASGNISGAYSAGGLIGEAYASAISDSYATGDITNSSYNTAGLIGANHSTISNSWASGTVTVTNPDSSSNTGGLVGENYNTISNSWASGAVTTVDNDNVGGLVGFNSGGVTIEKSYSIIGDVISDGENVGGLVGLNAGIISKSYSTRNVEGYSVVGGLLGILAGGSISDCYSAGNVVVSSGIGGSFIGVLSGGSINYSYSTGAATGDGTTSPFGGTGDPSGVSNSYWDVDTSGVGSSGDNNLNAIGKTTSEMKTLATFSGWDISEGSSYSDPSIWFIDNSNDYPKLLNEPEVETLNPTVIESNKATLEGVLKYFYDLNVRFQYRKTGTDVWTNTSVQYLEETGEYELEILELDSDENFEVRAVVNNGDSDIFGEIVSFSTLKASPAISSSDASNVYPVSAKLKGEVTSMGDYDSAQVAFRYRETGDEEWTTTEGEEISSASAFEKVIQGLSVGTQYEYQAKITFGDSGVVYGDLVNFTTLYGKVNTISYSTISSTTTTTTAPETTTTTTSAVNVMPLPEKPIAEMNQTEKDSYTMQLQQFLINLLTQLLTLLSK